MSQPFTPELFQADRANPAGYGLYDVALARDWSGRFLLGGVEVSTINCDLGFGTWPNGFCEDPGDISKAAERSDAGEPFFATTIWAADECGTGGVTEAEALSRAQHTLALQERVIVETAFAEHLLDALVGTPTVVPDFPTAIGVLEERLGRQGYLGVIHLPRRWAGLASQYRWANQSGPVYTSPLGHKYAFGAGYADPLGNTILATGPVYYWRSGEDTNAIAVTEARVNRVYAIAERHVLLGYEQCFLTAVEIEP